MAQHFKEKAHLKTNRDAYAEGWERIFGKKEEVKEEEICCEDPACFCGGYKEDNTGDKE